jgi:hypothetical protein
MNIIQQNNMNILNSESNQISYNEFFYPEDQILSDYGPPLMASLSSGNNMYAIEVIGFMRDENYFKGGGEISLAIENNNQEEIEWLIKACKEPNGYYGCKTPLGIATIKGDIKIAKMLVKNGGNPNIGSDEGFVPALHYACRYGHMDILEYFLNEAGGDLYLFNEHFGSLLSFASWFGNLEIVKYLIEQAEFNPKFRDAHDNDGCIRLNPLYLASKRNNHDVVEYLVKKAKLDINKKDSYGNTVLMDAVKSLNLGMVKNLYSLGASVTCKNLKGMNALKIAKAVKKCFEFKNRDDFSDAKNQMIEYLESVTTIEYREKYSS